MKIHEKFMKTCLKLALKGLNKTQTNPLVGCVIVHKGKIISKGYHKKYGDHHAEVNAIKKIKNTNILAESTLYVNLEPCSHYGKTPPCVDLIIKSKIKNIVIGTKDPFKKVNGKGYKKLQKKTNIITGVLASECIKINKQYFINHYFKRPLIILKWAQSKDGFVNNFKTGKIKISCEDSHILTHKWRSEVDGIMVGTKTILCDNPKLTTRKFKGKNPIRITIDRDNIIKGKKWHILNNEAKTIIINTTKNKVQNNIEYLKIQKTIKSKKLNDKEILVSIVKKLYKKGIKSILIEGGPIILQNYIDINLWDEIRYFKCSKLLNQGIKAPIISLKSDKNMKTGSDNLNIIYNKETHTKLEQTFYENALI